MVSGWRRTRQCTGQEGFGADHVALAADGAIAERPASESLVTVAVVFHRVRYFVRGSCDAEQPAAGGEPGGPVAIGQQAVTAVAFEAVGSTCSRKRRMNSSASSVMVFGAPACLQSFHRRVT